MRPTTTNARVRPVLAAAVCCLGASVLIAGCPKPPPPPPKPPSEQELLAPQVKHLSEEAQALLKDQGERLWAHWTQGVPLDLAPAYAAHPDLFTAESIRKVDRLRRLTHDGREIRALTSLQTYLVSEYLAAQLIDVNDAIANLEASMTFPVDGKDVAYHDLERLLANERNATKRRALWDAATPSVARLTESIQRKDKRTDALLQQLGYASYQAFGAELRQADLDRLGILAGEILQVTEAPFRRVLETLSQRELGVDVKELRRWDIPRLFKPRGVDAFFPKEALWPRALATLHGVGIEPALLPNLKLDGDERPKKNPRPLCVSVDVPSDVRLSFVPTPGERALAALMHELGLALHDVYTREPRFELAKLGDATGSEAFAALLEDLTEDPLWLEEQAGLSGDKLSAYLAATSAHKLFQIRRAAGRLLYSLELHRGVADPPALYRAVMARAYGVSLTDEDVARWAIEEEDFYASADFLRAWFLAGQLQAQLKARFGPSWWHAPAAGAFLEFLMAKGNALAPRELARLAGEDGIKPDVLLLRLGTTLQVPLTLPAHGAIELDDPPRADAGSLPPLDGGTRSDHALGATDAGGRDAGTVDAGAAPSTSP